MAYNRRDADETLKLSEHVLKKFTFAPLFSPINTFAFDWTYDRDDPDGFNMLRLLIDLENLFRTIRYEDSINYDEIFIPFFEAHQQHLIERVLEMMYNFLNLVQRNIHSIYSYAVSFFYGIDGYADDQLTYKELYLEFPYIRDNRFSVPSGITFSWHIIAAIQIYFNLKLSM